MITAHLAVLPVIVPMLAAPICILFPRLAWWCMILAAWLSALCGLVLLQQVQGAGEIVYAMGGWAAPWGIEYRVDLLNAGFVVLISCISAIILSGTRSVLEHEIDAIRQPLFYCAVLLSLTGLLGVLLTGDMFNLFVFVEIASLSSYALVSLGSDRRALLAAYRYLIFGTLGATFILLSIGFLYVMTGTLNMLDLAHRLPAVAHTNTVKVALAFFTVGIAIKCALFPFHMWLPQAYTYAPSAISSLLAATTTKVYVYVLLRFLYQVFGADYAINDMQLDRLLYVMAIAAIAYGSVIAVRENNLKRMLAYSSIAQIGYMVLGISLLSQAGMLASILHIVHHALAKAVLFLVLAVVVLHGRPATLAGVQGIGKQLPGTMIAFVIAGLALLGMPLTGGFVSKWYLLTASFAQDDWLAIVAIIIGSVCAVLYIWRVVEAIYFGVDNKAESASRAIPVGLLGIIWLLLLLNIAIGSNPGYLVAFATDISQSILP